MEGQRLLERILDGAEEPTDLPLALLQDITDNFSEERKIGQGGFASVYKGVLRERIVAVKRIHINVHTVDDKLFHREATSLMKINHRNVVRFLGLCSQGYQKPIDEDGSGNYIWANILERLLCFEYISNGSLDKHITDELRGLEWEARYEIIIGICKGLRYLHTERGIIHMDLKPENILLDHQDGKYMVPKITDFGLSRPNENSHTVGKSYGTRGYWAPEYREDSKTTPACDIYSLGLIIIELVTGCKDIPDKNNVLRRWRHRWSKPPTQLRYQQVARCMEIAGRCRAEKPEARPSISKIISFLSESESTYGPIIPCLDKDDMLRINPLDILFPFELKNEISHSVELTNDTLNCIAFNIQSPSAQPVKGIVPPGCTYAVKITVLARDVGDKFIVKSMKWTEGLGLEDIMECMSCAEAHKVVDEVDLMVVYEPTKAQENCKRREDTNIPAEEVPEAKKRKIVESAFRKGKNKIGSNENAEEASMDINSSMQGQCTEQTEQRNLHPPRSFSRHYPTSTKYLGNKSPAVDHTRGAMGSLLDKLGKLVTVDYSLDTRIKSDIDSFSVQLQKIHLELPKLKNVDGIEVLVDEVRELSYNIQDMVDSFLVHVKPDASSCGFKEIMHESVKLWENDMMTHHQIGDVIRNIKNQVQAVVRMKEDYNFNVNDVAANAMDESAIEALRNSAIYVHKELLVGIKAPRDELIRLLQEDGDALKKNLKIISIVGMGGLGKTTLAKAVQDKMMKKTYDSKAFVSFGQNPNVEAILIKTLRKFIKDFDEKNMDLGDLIGKLREFLMDKRYFIVIDDIWDLTTWDNIKFAFPKTKPGSIMITTTRILPVARACCNNASKYVHEIKALGEEESKRLFLGRIFGPENDCSITARKEEISKYILKTCGGMPLAINSIGRLLAGEPDSTWENVWKSLGALTEGNTERKSPIDNMEQILDLSYMYLPDHLKTCLLHVCMYPEDREIEKKYLLKQWVSEGFVSTNGRLDAEDVAENYFVELINMCMIQPGKIDYYNNEVLSCRVHDIILDLMRSKSTKVNFTHVTDGSKYVTGARGEIRRVSVQCNDEVDSRILKTIKGSLSHARSVLLYRRLLFPDFLKYKYVRVLHLEDKVFSTEPVDLTGISSLFLLRYLKIVCHHMSKLKLPDQIGQLQQLETIYLKGGTLKNYPSDIITLPWLSHLRYSGWRGIMLPDGIERLKSLHTLEGVCVGQSSVETIKGLSKLTNLRNLVINSVFTSESEEVASARMNALHSSILSLSTSLRILTLEDGLSERRDFSSWSSTPFPQGSHFRKLHLRDCEFQRCPGWFGQLHYLYSLSIEVREVADGISIVEGLPSLAYLRFSTDLEEETRQESVVISGGGAFQALKHLVFYCGKASLTFEEGALPKLEKLDIMFSHHTYRRILPAVGIEHLPAPTLKEIYVRLSREEYDHDWVCMLEGSQNPDDCDDDDPLRKRLRKLRHLVKSALKELHPGADINIRDDQEDSDEEEELINDVISDNEEEWCYEEEDDDEGADEDDDEGADEEEDYYWGEEDDEDAYQVSGSQTSAQA